MRQSGWLLAGILATQGCAPRHESDRRAATLTVAVQADITGVYPALRNESYSFAVNGNVFEGLTVLGHGLGPQPALADRWETPDDRTWLFHLRPGMRFSDGALVRARDVVASVRYAANSASTRTLLAPVESVDAASEDMVRIRTRFPCPVLLAHLSFALVLPEAALSDTGRPPGSRNGALHGSTAGSGGRSCGCRATRATGDPRRRSNASSSSSCRMRESAWPPCARAAPTSSTTSRWQPWTASARAPTSAS